jgi:hypothetical protein
MTVVKISSLPKAAQAAQERAPTWAQALIVFPAWGTFIFML